MSKYKNLVEYRIYLNGPEKQNRSSSGWKSLELDLNENLKRAVNNKELQSKVKRLISSNTGEDLDWIFDLKIKESVEIIETQNKSTKNSSNSLSEDYDDFDEPDVKPSFSSRALSSMGKGVSNQARKIQDRTDQKKAKEQEFITESIEDISSIKLSDDSELLEEQLSGFISLASGVPNSRLPI